MCGAMGEYAANAWLAARDSEAVVVSKFGLCLAAKRAILILIQGLENWGTPPEIVLSRA